MVTGGSGSASRRVGHRSSGYVQSVSTIRPPEPLHLEPYVSEPFKRSPLVLVAAQINYEEIGDLVHGQARTIQKSLGSFWTALQPANQVRFTITPSGPIQDTKTAYRLQSADGLWAVMINSDSVAIETRAYDGWKDFAAIVTQAASAVSETLDPSQCLRLGLRYIDQVKLPDGKESWDGLITDSVRGLVNSSRFGNAILGSDQRHLLLLDEDHTRCMFHHGLAEIDGEPPGSTYLLDYDVFLDQPRAFEVDGIAAQAEVLHGYAGALFHVSIEPELHGWLKGDE